MKEFGRTRGPPQVRILPDDGRAEGPFLGVDTRYREAGCSGDLGGVVELLRHRFGHDPIGWLVTLRIRSRTRPYPPPGTHSHTTRDRHDCARARVRYQALLLYLWVSFGPIRGCTPSDS